MTALTRLAGLQRADGLFGATIMMRDGRELDDTNGFVTALVLRHLRHAPRTPRLDAVIGAALDGLARCEVPGSGGAYAFWPDGARPDWARAVPADVDDTALILTELHRHGRLDRDAVLRRICHVMLPWRVRQRGLDQMPPWIVEGSFLTWIGTRGAMGGAAPNVVDCCVNANVAALLAMIDARHLPGYDSALATILQGLAWASDEAIRLDALTPFYPSPRALLDAVEHAVECGADGLRPALVHLRAMPARLLDRSAGICRDAYGRTIWHAPAVEAAAALALPIAA